MYRPLEHLKSGLLEPLSCTKVLRKALGLGRNKHSSLFVCSIFDEEKKGLLCHQQVAVSCLRVWGIQHMASSGEVPYLVRVRFTTRFGFRVKVS